jgi:ribosome-associated heat shock protein Hsp15
LRVTARLDKWLWAVRLFKTRALATAAIQAGGVEINGQPTKPAREVHAGESEFEKLREQRRQQVQARPPGSGRPTKRERREVDRLFE